MENTFILIEKKELPQFKKAFKNLAEQFGAKIISIDRNYSEYFMAITLSANHNSFYWYMARFVEHYKLMPNNN